MNKSIKTFACAFVASITFFACDDTGTNVNSGGNNPCKIKALSKTCNDERCWYDESDSIFFRPYDPNYYRIDSKVQEWMEDQFATKSNDTRVFSITDIFIHENYVALLSIDGPTEREYWIDGKRVSFEEYSDSLNKQQEYLQESKIRGKRDLPISKEELRYVYDSDYARLWMGVPMTAKEIVELTENYKQLIIEFADIEATFGGGGVDETTSPPCD